MGGARRWGRILFKAKRVPCQRRQTLPLSADPEAIQGGRSPVLLCASLSRRLAQINWFFSCIRIFLVTLYRRRLALALGWNKYVWTWCLFLSVFFPLFRVLEWGCDFRDNRVCWAEDWSQQGKSKASCCEPALVWLLSDLKKPARRGCQWHHYQGWLHFFPASHPALAPANAQRPSSPQGIIQLHFLFPFRSSTRFFCNSRVIYCTPEPSWFPPRQKSEPLLRRPPASSAISWHFRISKKKNIFHDLIWSRDTGLC